MSAATPTVEEVAKLRPVSIELAEWSGPISPRYQWRRKLAISSDDTGAIRLSFHGNDVGQPKVSLEGTLAPAAWAILVEGLLAANAFTLSKDFIGERRARVGVSFNRIVVKIGAELECAIDFLNSDVDEVSFDPQRPVLELLREARKLATSPPSGAGSEPPKST